MMSTLLLGLGVLVTVGVCIRMLLDWHHARSSRFGYGDEEDVEAFEKDVEWQLQIELSNAIEASSKSKLTGGDRTREIEPLLPSSSFPANSPRVTFSDDHLTGGSWHDLKVYTRAELEQSKSTEKSFRRIETTREPEILCNGTTYEQPLYINPKQFHRILKRRMTRQLIEQYFRSRSNLQTIPELSRERLQRSRESNGQFWTLAKVNGMPNGVAVA